MDKNLIKKNIKELSIDQPWNHNYNLYGIYTNNNQKKSIGNNEIKWERIKKFVDFKDKNVLDLACSDGYFSIQSLLNGSSNVKGIDLDNIRIKRANYVKSLYNYKNINFKIQDIYNLNLNKEKYDIILCLGLLHRIPDLDKLLNKISSSNSLLVIETKIFESNEAILKEGDKKTKLNKLNTLYHIPSYKYLEKILKNNNYNNIIFDIHPDDKNNYKRGLLICSKN